jgi:hypothetical protein
MIMPANGIHSASVEDGSLVLLHAGSLFQLNAAGAHLWTALIVERLQFDGACQLVADHFGVPEQRLHADSWKLVAQLADAGLIEVTA